MFAAEAIRGSAGIAVRVCGGLKICAGGSAVDAPTMPEVVISE